MHAHAYHDEQNDDGKKILCTDFILGFTDSRLIQSVLNSLYKAEINN
jgi:hypothetical protein